MEKPIFTTDQHRAFYERQMTRVRNDSYHKAFFYLMGVSADTRKMVGRVFDFEDDTIRCEILHEGWQTRGTYRLCLLAFNLWNGYSDFEHEQDAMPDNLFACGFVPYMMEGIKLRYPEYCREIKTPKGKTPAR